MSLILPSVRAALLRRPSRWTPANIQTALWLDAADAATITLNGSTVSQWNDKSGNGFHLTQGTAANQPTYSATGLNGRPTLSTDGNDVLSRSNVPILKNVGQGTIAIVVEYPAAASFVNGAIELYVAGGTALTRMVVTPNTTGTANRQSIGGRRLDADSFAAVNSSTDSLALRGSPFFKVAQLDYQNAQANHWTNGTQDLTAAAFQSAGNTSNTDAGSLSIFGAANIGQLMPSGTKISEIIVVENTISAINRQRIDGYLAHKWGLTANPPSNHPYKIVGPTP